MSENLYTLYAKLTLHVPWLNIIHCYRLYRICRHLYAHMASSQVISHTPSALVPWQPGLYCHNSIWNSECFVKLSDTRVALLSGCVAVSLNIKTHQELCCEASPYSLSALGFAHFAIRFGRFAADIIATVVFHTVNANWSSELFFVFIKTYHSIHETRCQNSIPLFSTRKKALASIICCSVLILPIFFVQWFSFLLPYLHIHLCILAWQPFNTSSNYYVTKVWYGIKHWFVKLFINYL